MKIIPVLKKNPIIKDVKSCGCIRGYYLCAEAQKLWAYGTYYYNEGMTKKYKQALKKYDNHFNQ